MRGAADFRNEPLADMVAVGLVEAHRVRLWMRSARPGRLAVSWWAEGEPAGAHETRFDPPAADERDGTTALTIPPDGALSPSTPYRFRVAHADGHTVGEGRFETAPAHPGATPTRFAFALMSCHQPFDAAGRVRPSAPQMLRAAQRCLAEHDARFVLMVGDQMYADDPPALSLFDPDHFADAGPPGRRSILDCTAAEVRRLYQRRYRHFWGLPEMQALQAAYPCYMILDDHDVANNWGSNPAHQIPPWRTVGEGALAAFADYQAARIRATGEARPEDFHYAFTYGHTAVFVMDLRTGRRAGPGARLAAERQFDDLQRFLEATRENKKIVAVVLSVPLVHVPRRLARLGARLPGWGEDFSDRWSSDAHVRDRDRLLATIHAHQVRCPEQRVLLLSGDIHIGCVHRICWPDAAVPPLYQLIASPLTHETPRWVQLAAKQFMRLKHVVATHDGAVQGRVEAVPGVDGCARNYYGGLNLGVVEVETPSPGAAPRVRLLLYGHRGDEPVCVFHSPPL